MLLRINFGSTTRSLKEKEPGKKTESHEAEKAKLEFEIVLTNRRGHVRENME